MVCESTECRQESDVGDAEESALCSRRAAGRQMSALIAGARVRVGASDCGRESGESDDGQKERLPSRWKWSAGGVVGLWRSVCRPGSSRFCPTIAAAGGPKREFGRTAAPAAAGQLHLLSPGGSIDVSAGEMLILHST